MQGLIDLLLLVRDLVISALKAMIWQPTRQRYERSILINAPKSTVWRMLRSRDITYPGTGYLYLRVVMEPVPGHPDLERARCITQHREYDIMMRIADERPEQAILIEIIAEGTFPAAIIGTDDYIGMVLSEQTDGTVLYLTRELTPTRWYSEANAKYGVRTGAQRYKTVIEMAYAADSVPGDPSPAMAFQASQAPPAPPKTFTVSRNSVLISLIAVASFAYMWGWQFALIVAGIIMIHELGHALAMILVGIPVKGVYLVPFFGGAAVAAAPYRSEGQAGFVALMGPGFSLLSTIALGIAAQQTAIPLLFKAAHISAIINLVNLAPIIPLDGGRVIHSVLLSFDRSLAFIVGLLGAAGGFWLAWHFRDPIIGLAVALGLFFTFKTRKASSLTLMRWPAALTLLLALVATALIYVIIIYIVQRDGNMRQWW
jgi:Zn-dependent protease